MDTQKAERSKQAKAALALQTKIDSLNERAQQLCQAGDKQALQYAQQSYALLQEYNSVSQPLTEYHTRLKAQTLALIGRGALLLPSYQEADNYLQQALQLYTEIGDEIEQMQMHKLLGSIYWYRGQYKQSFSHLFQSLTLSRKYNNKESEADMLHNLSTLYDMAGDFSTALDYLRQSLALNQELGNHGKVNKNLFNIGLIYAEIGEYTKAFAHYEQCLKYEKNVNDLPAQVQSLQNIGAIHGRLHEYDKALAYFTEALVIQQQLDNKEQEAMIRNNRAETYCFLQQYENAEREIQQCLDLYAHHCQSSPRVYTLTTYGTILSHTQRIPQAIEVLHTALADAEEMGVKLLLIDIHKMLYNLYKSTGDMAHALEHHEHLYAIDKEVFNEQNSNKLNTIQTLYQLEGTQKELEIYQLRNVALAQANEQLQALDREKNEVLNIVAHDLKNPLNSILLLSRLLSKEIETMDSADRREFIADIENTAVTMFDLINHLLDSNRINSQGVELVYTPCDFVAVMNTTIKLHSAVAAAKHISITFENTTCADTLYGTTDERVVQQILDNLVSNAIKFSQPHTTVSLSLHCNTHNITIAVQDEGPGLTEEDKKNLFRKFVRLSAKPTGNEHSTGLGLSIVHKLVDALQGDIMCESEFGYGATFTVRIPVEFSAQQVVL